MVRPGEFTVNKDAEVSDIRGHWDAEFKIRGAEVEVGKSRAKGTGSPKGVIKGDKLCLIRVNPETVSGKPACHMLKALGSQLSSMTTRDPRCDNSTIINVHVDRSPE